MSAYALKVHEGIGALVPYRFSCLDADSHQLDWEDRAEIVKGVASLIGIARLAKDEMGAAASRLALPFAERAAALASQQGRP